MKYHNVRFLVIFSKFNNIMHNFLDAQATLHMMTTSRHLTYKKKTPQILIVAEKHGAPEEWKTRERRSSKIHGN